MTKNVHETHCINIINDTVEFQGSFRMIMVDNGVAVMSLSKDVTKAAICQSNLPLFKRLEKGQTRNFGLELAYWIEKLLPWYIIPCC